LWGFQAFGRRPGPFNAALAGFGENGDRAGWEDFLRQAGAVLHEHGDAPWVHWASYEKTKITAYIDRYGDRDGIAARVRANLLDLLPVTQHAVALPLPSYSLKVVEEYVGFRRSQSEYGGDWAMAKYIEAVETEDEETRRSIMGDILRYNE